MSNIDWAVVAHHQAEGHVEACLEAESQDTEGPETLGPFCGCTTCIVREALWAAWPSLVQLMLEMQAAGELLPPAPQIGAGVQPIRTGVDSQA